MNSLFKVLGRALGIGFAPDNHVVPVLRLGRYHRVKPPGFLWIIPLLERTLPPVKTGIHVGNFVLTEVLSCDNIHFTFHVTVLFTFKPDSALKEAAAQLVRGGDNLLHIIVKDYTNQGLRRLASRFRAEDLCGAGAISIIEWNLTRFLTAEMRVLGIAPLKSGGILIKETIAPERFKRTMLKVRQDEALLEVIRSYPVPELLQLLNQVMFVNNLEDHSGELALMMGSPEAMQMFPLLGQNAVQGRNGHDY